MNRDKHIGNEESKYGLMGRAELLCGIVLTLAAVLLHFTFMRHAGTFWRDEIISIAGLSDIWNHVKFDSMPALLSVALRLWTWVATESQSSLRLFGCMVGIGTLAVLWLNGRMLGYRVPLLSIAFFVFNPISVPIGDSLRPYGLGILLILLTIGLLWKVTEQGRPWQFVAAAATAVLSVQCTYQNAVLLAAVIFAGVAVSAWRRRWKRVAMLVATGAAAAASLVPYLPVIRSAKDWMVILKLPVGFPYIFQGLAAALSGGRPLVAYMWVGSSLLAVGVLAYSLRTQLKQKPQDVRADRLLYCGVVGIACTVMLLLFLKSMQVGINPWYYLPLMGIGALSLDGVLGNSNMRSVVRIAVAAVVGVAAFSGAWQSTHMSFTNVDKVAAVMESSAQKEDLIIINPWYMAISFKKYYHGQTPYTTIPPLERYDYDVIKAQMASVDPIQPILSDLSKTLQSGHKLWIVGGMDFSQNTPPPALSPAPNGPKWPYYGIYTDNWEQQVACFVRSHARAGKLMPPVTDEPVFGYENCPITELEGWRP